MKKILFFIFVSTLIFSSCSLMNNSNESSSSLVEDSESNAQIPNTGNHEKNSNIDDGLKENNDDTKTEPWINPNQNALPLTLDDIMLFSYHDDNFTITKADLAGLNMVFDDLTGELTYYSTEIEYVFRTDFLKTAFVIRILDKGTDKTIKGIHVGMTLEELLNVFPQYTNWETTKDGYFYNIDGVGSGNVLYTSYTDQKGEVIDRLSVTIMIAEEMPFLVVTIKDGIVEYFELIYDTLTYTTKKDDIRPEPWVNPTPNALPLTLDDILNLSYHDDNFTIAKADSSGLNMVFDDLTGELTYYSTEVEYVFRTEFSNTAYLIRIFDKGADESIKGVQVGMTFEELLNKFPQYTNWETTRNGYFYNIDGEGSGDIGIISTPDSKGEFFERLHITFIVDGEVPFLVVTIKDGIVEYFELIYAVFS